VGDREAQPASRSLASYNDPVMGDWYFSYDALDRLTSATPDIAKGTLKATPVQNLSARP